MSIKTRFMHLLFGSTIKNMIAEHDKAIKDLQRTANDTISSLRDETAITKRTIKKLSDQNTSNERNIKDLVSEHKLKDIELSRIQKSLNDKNALITQKDNEIFKFKNDILKLKDLIKKQDDTINTLTETITLMNDSISEMFGDNTTTKTSIDKSSHIVKTEMESDESDDVEEEIIVKDITPKNPFEGMVI